MADLNGLKHDFYRMDFGVRNSKGKIWQIDSTDFTLIKDGFYDYGFISNVDLEVISFSINSDSNDLIISLFEGSIWSGGLNLIANSLNRGLNRTLPVDEIKENIIVSAIGNRIIRKKLIGGSAIVESLTPSNGQNIGMIMSSDISYRIRIENKENNSRDFVVSFVVGTIN